MFYQVLIEVLIEHVFVFTNVFPHVFYQVSHVFSRNESLSMWFRYLNSFLTDAFHSMRHRDSDSILFFSPSRYFLFWPSRAADRFYLLYLLALHLSLTHTPPATSFRVTVTFPIPVHLPFGHMYFPLLKCWGYDDSMDGRYGNRWFQKN